MAGLLGKPPNSAVVRVVLAPGNSDAKRSLWGSHVPLSPIPDPGAEQPAERWDGGWGGL